MRPAIARFALLSVLATPGLVASSGGAAVCPGDCDGNRRVGIGEIIRSTRVLLDMDPLDSCAAVDVNGDLVVTVDELIDTVRAGFEGCPGRPGARCFLGRDYLSIACYERGTTCDELIFNVDAFGFEGTCCTRPGYPCDTDEDCCRPGPSFHRRPELCVEGRCCVQRSAMCSREDAARRSPCCDPNYECKADRFNDLRCQPRGGTTGE